MMMSSLAHAPRTVSGQKGKMVPVARAHGPTERFLLKEWTAVAAIFRVRDDVTQSNTYAKTTRLAAWAPFSPFAHLTVHHY